MSHCIKKLWAGNTALFLMLAFGPLPLIMMLALGFSELVFNWVVLRRESVLQPRVGAEWVLLGLSVLSLWHLCGVSALQVGAGRMKGICSSFAPCPQCNSVALGCGERPEAIATHTSCHLAMTPEWELGERSIPIFLAALVGIFVTQKWGEMVEKKRRLKSDSSYVHCSCRELLDFLECVLL